MFKSPIERMIAEGKVTAVPAEEMKRIEEHMKKTYVPSTQKHLHQNAERAAKIRDKVLIAKPSRDAERFGDCKTRNCDELVPRYYGMGVPVDDGDDGECLLRDGHEGEHLVQTERGYYLWIPQDSFCEVDGVICECDYIECYVYERISDAEGEELLAKNGIGTD